MSRKLSLQPVESEFGFDDGEDDFGFGESSTDDFYFAVGDFGFAGESSTDDIVDSKSYGFGVTSDKQGMPVLKLNRTTDRFGWKKSQRKQQAEGQPYPNTRGKTKAVQSTSYGFGKNARKLAATPSSSSTGSGTFTYGFPTATGYKTFAPNLDRLPPETRAHVMRAQARAEEEAKKQQEFQSQPLGN